MKETLIVFTFFIFSINLSFAQTKEEKKKDKEETAKKEYEAIKSLIEAGEYQFVATWASTQKGRRINLTTNYGDLKINKDKAEADLPYFGVVQTASYTGDGGIKFKNEGIAYQIETNEKKQMITITFKANQKTEALSLILSVFKSGNASLKISSSHRNSISYDGKVSELVKSE